MDARSLLGVLERTDEEERGAKGGQALARRLIGASSPSPPPEGGRARPLCAVCATPVRGVAWYCGACGHGGHLACMRGWLGAAANGAGVCPTGCGCTCRCVEAPEPQPEVETEEVEPEDIGASAAERAADAPSRLSSRRHSADAASAWRDEANGSGGSGGPAARGLARRSLGGGAAQEAEPQQLGLGGKPMGMPKRVPSLLDLDSLLKQGGPDH